MHIYLKIKHIDVLINMVFDIAGIETTSTSLSYTLLYLAIFPETQKKLQEEIDKVIGTRIVSLEDRKRYRYNSFKDFYFTVFMD